MKKITLTFLLTLLVTSFFAQGYFENKGKKINPMDFAAELTSGPKKYDYSRFVADKRITVYIDTYSPKSIYNDFDINKKLKKLSLEEKTKLYNSIWAKAYEESSLINLVDFKIETKNITDMSDEEKKNALFLSFMEYYGFSYALLWYFDDKMKESILTATFVKDYDLIDKNDLRLLLNQLYFSLTPNTDKVLEQLQEEQHAAFTTEEKGAAKRKTLATVFADEESQDNWNELLSRQVAAFFEMSGTYTLLVPEELKDKDTEEALKKWDYSDYRIVPKNEIENARNTMDSNLVYVRVQSMVAGASLIYLISSSDKILYTYSHNNSSIAKMAEGLSGNKTYSLFETLILELKEKEKRLLEKNGTMVYHKLSFKQETLPKDLVSAKVVFVRMKENEHRKYKLYNKYFEQEMEKYPYNFEIVDELPSDYDYRIFIKSTIAPLEIATTRYKNANGTKGSSSNYDFKQSSVDYSFVESFYVYLENKNTKELYRNPAFEKDIVINNVSDMFWKEIRHFVKEAKQLSK